MRTAYRGLPAVLIALALGAAACGGSEDPSEDTGADDAAATEAAAPQAPPPEGDCEADTEDAVAAARPLMDEQVSEGDANFEGSAEVCGIDEFEIEVIPPQGEDSGTGSASFSPSVLVGEPGQELTVRVVNRDVVVHAFTLEEQDIDEVLQPATEPGEAGDPVEVTVTFPSDGEPVLFTCRFHKLGGKHGALVTN